MIKARSLIHLSAPWLYNEIGRLCALFPVHSVVTVAVLLSPGSQ